MKNPAADFDRTPVGGIRVGAVAPHPSVGDDFYGVGIEGVEEKHLVGSLIGGIVVVDQSKIIEHAGLVALESLDANHRFVA